MIKTDFSSKCGVVSGGFECQLVLLSCLLSSYSARWSTENVKRKLLLNDEIFNIANLLTLFDLWRRLDQLHVKGSYRRFHGNFLF